MRRSVIETRSNSIAGSASGPVDIGEDGPVRTEHEIGAMPSFISCMLIGLFSSSQQQSERADRKVACHDPLYGAVSPSR